MNKLTKLAQIGRAFGMRDSVLRLNYEMQRGTGLMSRRMRSAAGWDRWSLQRIAPGISAEQFLRSRRQGSHPFFFADARTLADPLRNILATAGEKSVLTAAENILGGNLPFFGRLSFACGFPPNWFQNPATAQRVSPSRPWTTMRFASPDYGDLKFILEPSRFLFVYPLARAYALSGDERFAETFWRALEDWAHKSPPMSGPLWVCGQESSLRILAWCFAFHAFLDSSTTTGERAAQLVSMIAAHAWRVEQTLGYARSQRSNHLFSEAVALCTVGTLYPELKQATSWQALGVHLLQEAVLDQITPEGVHLQYSFNYQRMVLHLLLWTLRLAEISSCRLPSVIQERAAAMFDLMRAFVDQDSGRVPNYGSNDGSHILPLTSCDYGDFRPLVQMGARILNRGPALLAGVWDEAVLWICGKPAESAPAAARTLAASTGYHRLGSGDSWALVRAGHYQRRPFQADQLHVDLWWKGLNLARDAGTYLYNGEPPWDNGLARTMVHNTVTVDGRDQMRRAGRFLWLDWAQASGRSFSTQKTGAPDRFEGEHDGYRTLGIKHRRSLQGLPRDSGWVVVDDVLGSGEHEVRLHWLVADLPFIAPSSSAFEAVFTTPHGLVHWHFFASGPGHSAIVREGKSSTPEIAGADIRMLGWESPTYGQLCPAVSLVYRVHLPLPVRLLTVIRLEENLRLESSATHVILHRGDEEIQRIALHP